MKRKAFTLLEILITITIIVILAVSVILLMNPLSIMNRANDVTRKKNLDDAKKMLEQYITDTGCYPQPTEICTDGNNASPCHICTKAQPTQFTHFTKEICDPKHGTSDYLYQTENDSGSKGIPPAVLPCPKWFKIFSVLDSVYNPQEDIWGCKKAGCGLPPTYGYSYLVTSPGAPADQMITNNWYCFTSDCVQCSPYENCTAKANDCYGKALYPSRTSCCNDHDPHSPYCL